MDGMELVCFKIISSVGEAKSNYILAMEAARKHDFEKAEELMREGDSCFVEGHKAHGSLIQQEASGDKVEVSLLLVHSEDQLLGCETIKTMALEVIELHKQLHELQK